MRAKTLAVLLCAAFAFSAAAQQVRYHQNIHEENNTFEDVTLPLVWARSASNVVLRNNRIVNGNAKVVIDRNRAEVKVEDAK